MEKYEDFDICSKCGGECCKKSGCDYFISDFESMKIDYLDKILEKGYTSIVAALDFTTTKNRGVVATPILYMRARNTNRDVIDLLSMKTRCLSLGENGCLHSFEERPSGGSTLIPKENLKCYSEVDRLNELKKWLPYQRILQRLVKRYTGMSVEAKLRQDVKKLFEDIIEENFEGIHPIELLDIKNLLPNLAKAYPIEYVEALNNNVKKISS